MSTRVLFIAGMGRSGTTLLERVLGQLPGVGCLGETVHGWERGAGRDELCGCGKAFGDCPFWTEVGALAFGGWDRVDLSRIAGLRERVDRVRHVPRLAAARPGSRLDRARAEYAGYFSRLYAAAADVAGAGVVVDSSKQASLPHVLARDPGIDLRVLHVVRDSRAVAHAWTKHVLRPESAEPGAEMPRYSPAETAVQWSAHNAAVELLRARNVPVLRIRYEDFAARPAAVLSRVAGFAGLPSDPAGWDFLHGREVRLDASHTVAGNPMRFTTGKLTVRPDQAWRTALSDRDRLTVTALTLPMLTCYRYPLGL
jgi:hypothetical protein